METGGARQRSSTEVDDVVTEKRKRQRENRTKDRNIDSIVFVFKLATPIDLDRHPAIEFACAHKKEKTQETLKSQSPQNAPHRFIFSETRDRSKERGEKKESFVLVFLHAS